MPLSEEIARAIHGSEFVVVPDCGHLIVATLINRTQCPVLLLGMLVSQASATVAIRQLAGKTKLPVVCSYQGAGNQKLN